MDEGGLENRRQRRERYGGTLTLSVPHEYKTKTKSQTVQASQNTKTTDTFSIQKISFQDVKGVQNKINKPNGICSNQDTTLATKSKELNIHVSIYEFISALLKILA